MGKFQKLKEDLAKQEQKEEEESEVSETENLSGEESDTDSERYSDNENTQTSNGEPKRALQWTNRERVLVLCSRGADARTRHLMNDLKVLMPHAKSDSKLEKQQSLTVLNEIAEIKNCTKIMYFESRKKKDVYLWISNVDNGPSVKFLLHNVHTMMELKMSGNCLKASRPVLSFDSKFDEVPHLSLIKQSFMQTFSTANHHPRSQPFIDHVFSFSVTDDGKIWFRNFQIVDDTLQLQEIGPRFVLEIIRIFDGSFQGTVLYDNPDYESPNAKRRAEKLKSRGKIIEKELHKKSENVKYDVVKSVLAEKMEDPAGEIFDTEKPITGEDALQIASAIDKKRPKKKKQTKKARLEV